MKRMFILAAAIPDLEILASKSPITPALREIMETADFHESVQGRERPELRRLFKQPITAATDPWSEVEYQSLYLTDMDPANRIILQEPSVKDPMTGIMVLKAARLRGESGLVYCGTPEQLKNFAAKLQDFETKGDELDEKDFLECLIEAAKADGLKIIYYRLSPEHGGDDDGE